MESYDNISITKKAIQYINNLNDTFKVFYIFIIFILCYIIFEIYIFAGFDYVITQMYVSWIFIFLLIFILFNKNKEL